MKKHLLFLTLAAVLSLLPFGARAQEELTVCDSTAYNSYVPVYGLYVDDYQHSQSIYPASMLEDMSVGSQITSLTYYLKTLATGPWTSAHFIVSISEVDDESFSSANFLDNTGFTVVYSGTLDGQDSTMLIEFEDPYTYEGGNLIVDSVEDVDGTFKSASFYGINSNGGSVT